jgi:hypothetical protein
MDADEVKKAPPAPWRYAVPDVRWAFQTATVLAVLFGWLLYRVWICGDIVYVPVLDSGSDKVGKVAGKK